MVANTVLLALVALLSTAAADEYGFPDDRLALRYRIELADGNEWKAVESTRKFRRNHTIRIRFSSNEAGTLYVLNASAPNASLHPVFPPANREEGPAYLGSGAPIAANRVGFFPDPHQGESGMRFTGAEGVERFLLVYIPNEHTGERSVLAVASGAEQWHFDNETSHLVTGEPRQALFHYFELKSR